MLAQHLLQTKQMHLLKEKLFSIEKVQLHLNSPGVMFGGETVSISTKQLFPLRASQLSIQPPPLKGRGLRDGGRQTERHREIRTSSVAMVTIFSLSPALSFLSFFFPDELMQEHKKVHKPWLWYLSHSAVRTTVRHTHQSLQQPIKLSAEFCHQAVAALIINQVLAQFSHLHNS